MEDMENSCTNYRRVRHRDRMALFSYAFIHPCRDAPEEIGEWFAAVRRCFSIGEPSCDSGRLFCLNIDERASSPAPVVAVSQERINHRVERKRRRGLTCP